MIDLVKAVRAKVLESCCVKVCKKEGCKVSLPRECRQRVLINMDLLELLVEKHGKRCDFLFVGEAEGESWVVPIELKKGKASSSEVVLQLQAGAKVAEKIVPNNVEISFRPVVAASRFDKYERGLIRRKEVKFRGMSELVRRIKCGESLAKVIC